MNAEQQQVLAPRKRGRGRPATRDWEGLRGEIELLIQLGYTTAALGQTYGLTRIGMHKVLARLGLRTEFRPGQRAQSS